MTKYVYFYATSGILNAMGDEDAISKAYKHVTTLVGAGLKQEALVVERIELTKEKDNKDE